MGTRGTVPMPVLASRKSVWKWMFALSALPKRWTNVTAPLWLSLRVQPAFLMR